MDDLNKTANSGGDGDFSSYKNQSSLDMGASDSLCTKDRNIRDALANMKMLQDLTISTRMNKHTELGSELGKPKIVDAQMLQNLQDFDVKDILEKRFAELLPAERVVLTLYFINQ